MTRDEYIQTEVMGKCWHEIQTSCLGDICLKCKEETFGFAVLIKPNFSTSHAYELQQFVLGADWWPTFDVFAANKMSEINKAHYQYITQASFIAWLFSDADRFADLVAEFRGYTPEKEG
jgi:hypothetical protein